MHQLICGNCQTTNATDSIFCKQCGQKLVRVVSSKEEVNLHSVQRSVSSSSQEKLPGPNVEIEGERKPVTILFTDIVGSTAIAEKLDPEEWKEVIQGAHRRVTAAISRYDGTIAQLLGDGVLAFFGAPLTHEDDPERAARAALDIQASMIEYQRELLGLVQEFKMRVGIHSGEVVLGEIGAGEHTEYLAIGDAVNIAARLEGLAEPGQIVVSENIAQRISATIELQDLGEFAAKGITDPLRVYAVLKIKVESGLIQGLSGERSSYVGRAEEVKNLGASLLSMCKGQGQVVTILGEAGIGKSRLLEHVRDQLNKIIAEDTPFPPASIHWLESRALSFGGALSFWMISQLLFADLGLSAKIPKVRLKVALRRRVTAMFGEAAVEVLPYLSQLLDLTVDEDGPNSIQSLGSETLKHQTLQSLSIYFSKVARIQPTVLVLEDVHWADPSSLKAIEEMLALTDRTPLMILLLMRINPNHGSWGIKLKAETDFPHRYTEIHMRQLPKTDATEFVEQLLGSQALPEELLEVILSRSEGNPFYLEEVVRHLIEQGSIVQENGIWQTTGASGDLGIPDSLHGVLLARIDRLEGAVRSTLQMASVIGKSFQYRLLEAISDGDIDLDGHLSQLQRVDLVWEKARLPELEYIFKHSLTQEAAYSTLLHERRRELHQRVGQALRGIFTDREEEFYGLLAHHFEAAEDHEKALAYLIQAGDKTRHEDAHIEAADYYQRALNMLEMLGDDQLARATWLKLGLVYQTNFEFDAAHRAYEAAFALEQRVKNVLELSPESREDQHIMRLPLLHIETLDPALLTISTEEPVISQLFAGLARLETEMSVVPDVARSWEVLDDGTRYVFHLRDDVYWTDGRQVTADDFVWAWTRAISKSSFAEAFDAISGAREYRHGESEEIPGLRANNPLELEVRLQEPVAYFLYIIAGPLGLPIPEDVVQTHGEDWWKPDTIVSNGPFMLVGFDDEGLVLERNPTYFGDFDGNLDRVEFLFTRLPGKQQSPLRFRQYLDGELDIYFNILPEDVPVEVAKEELHFSAPTLSTYLLGLDSSKEPFDNLLVREALAYAINREEFKKKVPTVEILTAEGGLVPPGIPGHSPDVAIQHDPQLARLKLSEAGFPDGVGFPPLTLNYFYLINPENAAEIARQLQEVLGITTSIREFSAMTEFDDFQVWLSGWIAEHPDPHYFLGQSGIIRGWKALGWKDLIFDELIAEASRASDRPRRMELYRRADRRLVAEEVIAIPIYYGGRVSFLAKPWVKQFQYTRLSSFQLKDVLIEKMPGC